MFFQLLNCPKYRICQAILAIVTSPALAKKHVFGSSGGCRGGGCQTLACALEVQAYVENYGFLVICRVTVMVV